MGGRRRSATWTRQEIATLITLLKEYGTDFGIIGSKMGKEREQVKRKFKALEKSHPEIADSIFSARPFASYSLPIAEDQQEHNEFLDD